MHNDIKIARGTKRIHISDDDENDLGLYVVVNIEEYKHRHWWSLKCDWCIITGLCSQSDDEDRLIQTMIKEWTKQYPEIDIINTSVKLKYYPNLLKRIIHIEKFKKEDKSESLSLRKVICIDDGTLFKYTRTHDVSVPLYDNHEYWSSEEPFNAERLESFDKFLFIHNNHGVWRTYPKRLFKEIV